MLDGPEDTPDLHGRTHPGPNRRRPQKPAYFEKEMSYAEQKKAEADANRREHERRENERKQKMEARERSRRTMAKARSGGKHGQRKLGMESKVLLEKVRRLVGEE